VQYSKINAATILQTLAGVVFVYLFMFKHINRKKTKHERLEDRADILLMILLLMDRPTDRARTCFYLISHETTCLIGNKHDGREVTDAAM